jgi:hypothetical protein
MRFGLRMKAFFEMRLSQLMLDAFVLLNQKKQTPPRIEQLHLRSTVAPRRLL